MPIPVNNTSVVNGNLVAEGINATRMYWVSDHAFIFRNKEGTLMAWNNGTVEKLLDRVPEQFFYCKTTPPVEKTVVKEMKNPNPDEIPQNPIKAQDETLDVPKETRVFQANRDPASQQYAACDGINGKFSVGTIKGEWQTYGYAIQIRKWPIKQPPASVTICAWVDWRKKIDSKNEIAFAIPKEDDLDCIKDPSVYKNNQLRIFEADVPLDKTIAIRQNYYTYLVLKPTKLELKYRSEREVPRTWLAKPLGSRGGFFWGGWDWGKNGPIPVYKSLTCECKFWADIRKPAKGSSVTRKNQ